MSVSTSPPMFLQFFNPNNSGSPASGYQLFTYEAGTTTKQATWTDSTQTVENANPLALDSNGRAVVWGDPTLSYKLVIAPPNDTDPPSSPVWTQDNVEFPAVLSIFTQYFLGEMLWPQTDAEIAAGVTPSNYAYEPYDLRRYGGDPTGVATSDAALDAAISVCGTGGGRIRAPGPGVYAFANQLNADFKIAIIIEGDASITGGSAPATVFKYTGTTSPWMIWDSGKGIQFKNIYFTVTVMTGGTYLRFNNDGTNGDPSQCGIYDCTFDDPGTTNTILDINKGIEWSIDHNAFYGGLCHILGANDSGYVNGLWITRNNFGGSTGNPIQGGADAFNISNNVFEPMAGGVAGALGGYGGTYFAADTGCIDSNWFGDVSATSAQSWLSLSAGGVGIRGNQFNGNQTGTTAIAVDASQGIEIVANQFNALLNAIDFAASPCRGVVCKGNVASSTVTNPYENTSNVPLGQFDFAISFNFGIPSGHGALGPNGFKVNADGSIIQWGHATGLSNGSNTIDFTSVTPLPNALLNVRATFETVDNASATLHVPASGFSTTGFNVVINDSGATGDAIYWEATGY